MVMLQPRPWHTLEDQAVAFLDRGPDFRRLLLAAGARGPGDALFEIEADELRRIDIFGQPLQTIDTGGAIVGFDRGANQRFGTVESLCRNTEPDDRENQTQPKFIVIDEAVSSLDVSVQAQILNLIKRLQSEVGFAALFISHDLAAVRYIAARIAVMYSGEIVEFASAAHFYAETQHLYTRALQQASDTASDKALDLRDTPDEVATTGCPLHQRCPMTVARCRVEKPELRTIIDGLVACHRADELAATT